MQEQHPGKKLAEPPFLFLLPKDLLLNILPKAATGAAGAYASCRALRDAWQAAIRQPGGASAYLIARYGIQDAILYVYTCPGLLKFVLADVPAAEHDSRVLRMMKELEKQHKQYVGSGYSASQATALAAVAPKAAAAGHLGTLRWLLRRIPSPEQTSSGAFCLHEAAAWGHLNVVRWWLREREVVAAAAGNDGEETSIALSGARLEALIRAAKYDRVEVVRELLQARADPRVEPEALLEAARWGAEDTAAVLLAAGADASAIESVGLTLASAYGHAGIVRQLLEGGADPTAQESTALLGAAKFGHVQVARQLLEAGANPTARDNFAMHVAYEPGHIEVVRLLLSAAGGVDISSIGGRYLAFKSAEEGYDDIAETLLQRGRFSVTDCSNLLARSDTNFPLLCRLTWMCLVAAWRRWRPEAAAVRPVGHQLLG
ncbi:hypothetical protein Agub_g14371, partial [Astrephomene gubernaculifera]